MRFMFHTLSYYLKERPLITNMVLSTTVGFCGDIVCQVIYEPATMARPPLTRELLPDESVNSPFLIEVQSPYLVARSKWDRRRREQSESVHNAGEGSNTAKSSSSSAAVSEPANAAILLDLRRSMIFCSFTFLFGVPFFLQVYKRLDKLINPATITKRQAVFKGFLSWTAAQVTNPLYLTYVTALDHFFIYRDGRDGRRRVTGVCAAPPPPPPKPRFRFAGAGSVGQESPPYESTWFGRHPTSAATGTTGALLQQTVSKMGHHYRFADSTDFNYPEYAHCVSVDSRRKMVHDFPDILRYGFLFWGMNWLPMFYYIPGHFRLAYSSMVQVVWSGIMSHLMHRGGAQKKVDAQA